MAAVPEISHAQKEMHAQNGILERDNLTLATNNAHISIDNALRSRLGLSRMSSTYEQHVSDFLIAIKIPKSTSIPLHVSSYARHLYKKTYVSDGFKGQDQKIVFASCLFIACWHLKTPRTFREIFAKIPGASRAILRKIFKSLEALFDAENRRKRIGTSQGISTAKHADGHSTEQVICTLPDLMEQLKVEERPYSVSPPNAIVQASFAPTAPAPASIAHAEGNDIDMDIEMEISTTPAAPFIGHASHNSACEDNTISTLPPTTPATNTSRRNARATQNTLYNVICCRCGKILNMQNVHYAFYCLSCHHKRCDSCPMRAI